MSTPASQMTNEQLLAIASDKSAVSQMTDEQLLAIAKETATDKPASEPKPSGTMEQPIPYTAGLLKWKDIPKMATQWGGATSGAAGGAALGTAIAPGAGTILGSGLGFILGGVGGDMAGEAATEVADWGIDKASGGNATFPTLDQWSEHLPESAISTAALGTVSGAGKAIDWAAKTNAVRLANKKVANAVDKLVKTLRPTARELDFFQREPAEKVIADALDMGIFNQATDPKTLATLVGDELGKKGAGGTLGARLGEIGNAIDEVPGSGVKFKQGVEKSLHEALELVKQQTGTVDPVTGKPVTATADKLEAHFAKRLQKIKDGLAGESKIKADTIKTELEKVEGQLGKLEREWTTAAPHDRMTAQGKALSDKLQGLKSRRAKLLNDLTPLEQELANPAVGFNQAYNLQKTFDYEARATWDKATRQLTPEGQLDQAMSNVFRRHVKRIAEQADPELGSVFNALKRRYEVLEDLRPMTMRARKTQLLEPTAEEAGRQFGYEFRSIPGLDRIPGGKFIPWPQKANLRGPLVAEQFGDVTNALRVAAGNVRPEDLYGNLLRTRKVSGGVITVGTMLGSRPASRNVSQWMRADRGEINNLSNRFMTEALRQQGVDPDSVTEEDIPPEMLQQAKQLTEQAMQPLVSALQADDDRAVSAAVSKIAAQFDMFEQSKSGY